MPVARCCTGHAEVSESAPRSTCLWRGAAQATQRSRGLRNAHARRAEMSHMITLCAAQEKRPIGYFSCA
eukprot:4153857-Pleurochrysis_carterae.AAC.1